MFIFFDIIEYKYTKKLKILTFPEYKIKHFINLQVVKTITYKQKNLIYKH